jgi:hypothetical protein
MDAADEVLADLNQIEGRDLLVWSLLQVRPHWGSLGLQVRWDAIGREGRGYGVD